MKNSYGQNGTYVTFNLINVKLRIVMDRMAHMLLQKLKFQGKGARTIKERDH